MGRSHEAHRPSTYAGASKWRPACSDRYPRWHKVKIQKVSSGRAYADENRTDKKQHFSEKVTKVESILASDPK